MSKRRLTEQQKRRITERQEKARDKVEATGAEHEGLVIAYLGKFLVIEDDSKTQWRCHVRQNLGAVVVGDIVTFAEVEPEIGVVIACHGRRSTLTRPDHYKQEKVIAANIDQMVVVLSACPSPIWHFLDKYLVVAELQGFAVLIVLNKTDLAGSQLEELRNHLSIYQKLGYACVEASCVMASGLQHLQTALSNKTSIFVGQSGVGKSSLINALFGEQQAKIGEISQANQKGQHTTTSAHLYHFPAGGSLIDSPGIREFGLWHISKDQALKGFKEIHVLAYQCKFRDCQHKNTPGCAVEAAVKTGSIHSERLQSYFRVVEAII